MTQTNVMPADIQLERELLGMVIMRGGLGGVPDELGVEDFCGTREAKVYSAMLDLHHAGEEIDIGLLQRAVGPDIIVSEWIDGLPRNAAAETYAQRIKQRATWRSMATIGQELHGRALSGDGDPAELARSFAVDLASIARKGDANTFEAADGRYRLTVPAIAAELEVDHLRRESSHLKAEVLVRCALPGARTHDGGVLSVSDVNLSSSRARAIVAKDLDERARTDGIFRDVIEELALRIIATERKGEPDVALHELEAPAPTELLEVDGLLLPRRHPTVFFGDGDSAKSYLMLYVLGRLALEGMRVGLADWELSEEDHRERLGRLFPGNMPPVRYLRCARPIVAESDRLRRWVRDRGLEYIACDSVAYASAGAPENADVAMAYFQVIRQLGPIGSAHIAHVTKAIENADRRPFGSTFWHNSPRATWYVKRTARDTDEHVARIGFFPRKFNIGAFPREVGFELLFAPDRTIVRSTDVRDTPELAETMSVRQRMLAVLRHGAMSPEAIAIEIDARVDTIKREARRYSNQFTVIDGGLVALLEQHR